jgi:hypothetical protein
MKSSGLTNLEESVARTRREIFDNGYTIRSVLFVGKEIVSTEELAAQDSNADTSPSW